MADEVKVLYRTKGSATGGRDGQVQTEDGSLSAKLTTPKELGGPGGPGNNPEQLYAMGHSACFLGAMKFVASQSHGRLKVPADAKVTAEVGIGPRTKGGFGLEVTLNISLPGVPKEEAQELAETAHRDICPYSHATRGNIDVKLHLV